MNWFKCKYVNKSIEVDIFDEIGGWGIYAKDFKDEVNNLISENNPSEVFININSPGGSVFEGIAIHNYLKSLPIEVTAKIDGLAASIATIISLGADNIVMGEGSFFMIHNPSGGLMGEADDFRKQADVLDKIKDTLVTIYTSKSNLSSEKIAELMDNETWLTAQEALEFGFVDSIAEGLKAVACVGEKFKNEFNNIPNIIMENSKETVETVETPKVENTIEVTEETTSILDKLKNLIGLSEEKKEAHKELNNLYESVKTENVELTNKLDEVNALVDEQKDVLNKAHDEIVALKSEIENIKKENEELNAKLSEVEGEEVTPVANAKNETKKSLADYINEYKKTK